jgi:hypothetical protein
MNDIQKFLIERVILNLRKEAGALLADKRHDAFSTVPLEPVAVAESLVELENIILEAANNFQSNVATQAKMTVSEYPRY